MDSISQDIQPLVYRDEGGLIEIDLLTDKETVWLTQAQMAALFEKDVRTVNEHLGNVFKEQEVLEEATIRKFRIVQQEGRREVAREVLHYNLDAILSVGYRVNSKRGTQFRQWATRTLRQYLEQGYVLNKRRVRNLDSVNTILRRALKAPMDPQVRAGFLGLIDKYEHGFTLLDKYDHGSLDGDRDPQEAAAL